MSSTIIIEENIKVLIKSAGFVFIGMIISKLLTYFYKIFIARFYGPYEYGLFMIGISIINFFLIFTKLGLNTAVTRYIPYFEKNIKKIKGCIISSLEMVIITSIPISILLYYFSKDISIYLFHNTDLIIIIKILSLALPFLSLNYIINFSFVGFKKIKYQIYNDYIFLNLIKLLLVIFFWSIGCGLYGLIFAWVVAVISSTFIGIYYLHYKIFPPLFSKKIKSKKMYKELLSFSVPLIFTGLISFIITYTDTLMLGFFISSKHVGFYNAAISTAQLLTIIPAAITSIFLPTITSLYTKNKIYEIKRLYYIITKWIFCLNLPLILLLIVFSKEIIIFIFGLEYGIGNIPLILLSFGFFFSGTAVTASHILNMMKKTKIIFYITFITAVFNFTINLILIPYLGIIGAAISSVISWSINSFLLFFCVYYYFHSLPFSFYIFKSLFSGMISIASIFLIIKFTNNLLISVISCLMIYPMIYFLIFYLVKGISPNEIKFIKRLITHIK